MMARRIAASRKRASAPVVEPLTMVFRTTTANEEVEIICGDGGYNYNCTIDWGDGATSSVTAFDDPDLAHTFAAAGDHTVRVTGELPWIVYKGDSAADRIIEVRGTHTFLGGMVHSFLGAGFMTTFDTSRFNLASQVSFYKAWEKTSSLTFFDGSGLSVIAQLEPLCFSRSWVGCILDSVSVESIFVAIVNCGHHAPDAPEFITQAKYIDISSNGDPLTTAASNAVATLKSRGWVPTVDGVTL